MIICTICLDEKEPADFYIRNGNLRKECKACIIKRNLINRNKNPDVYRAQRRRRYHEIKQEIFQAYGNRCVCCGDETIKFLSIDHIQGGGNQHRASLPGGERQLFIDIVRAGFPEEYQLLCHNCNHGKFLNGGKCPGETESGHHGAWKSLMYSPSI